MTMPNDGSAVADDVSAARRAYEAALRKVVADPAAIAEYQDAARIWRNIDVDADGWPHAAPEAVLDAVRQLAGQASTHIGRVSGRRPMRALLRRLSRGRLGREHDWPVVPLVGTPWQDTVSAERPGWRQRAAYLYGEHVFGVDYLTCRRCGLGWVEQPYTEEQFRRRGVASAALATLRAEHPGLSWHTLGGHFPKSRPFWDDAGRGVPGGYSQRDVCLHGTPD